MKEIRSERLTIRQFRSDDPMLPYCYPADWKNRAVSYSPSMVGRYYAEYPLPGGGWFAICLNTTKELIGGVGLLSRYDLYEPPEVELAYGIAKQHRGNGYATEACKVILGYAIEKLRLPRLFAGVHIDNLASQRVAESIGMCYEYTIEWYGEAHRMYWYRQTPEKTEKSRACGTHPTSAGDIANRAAPEKWRR